MKRLRISRVSIPRNIWLLVLIWSAGLICDRVWFYWDHNVPGWDQADYLTGTLNYRWALQTPQWLNGEWWRDLWLLSSKIPPLTYITTALVQNVFGVGIDQATIVMSLYSAVLLAAVYGLGWILFDANLGLLAAGLCQIIPGLYRLRLEFLLDYPLAAMVTLGFLALTGWHLYTYKKYIFLGANFNSKIHWQYLLKSSLLAAGLGISLGLALLTKQTALFFLIIPIIWVGWQSFWQRRWLKFAQLLFSFWVSSLIFLPWYRTNWLTVITSGKRATIDSAIAEGDAPLNTWAAWTFYWEQLPHHLSLPLLLIPIAGLLIFYQQKRLQKHQHQESKKSDRPQFSPLVWLAIFLIAAYLLSSLNVNKDDRYIIPYLPPFSIVLAYGFTRLQTTWWRNLRLATLIVAVIFTLTNLFPLPGRTLLPNLTPRAQHYPYQGKPFPHPQVIQTIIQTSPYLRSTVGVLPSTYSVNQHNLNYYGAKANFQVYGRQVATNNKYINQDINALDWFITKTGNQGSIPDSQKQAVSIVETSPDFQLQQTWQLPDGESLKLYHKTNPPIAVKPVQTETTNLKLTEIIAPGTSPPGAAIPITYTWQGNLENLKQGVIIITWYNRENNQQWFHDHSIGMGNIYNQYPHQQETMQIRDRTAMLPPANIAPGTYRLQATYIHRTTQTAFPIAVPNITIEINPQAPATPAPHLDLPTQFRNLAATMPQGITAFDRIFAEVGRINQYDPTQDYLQQVLIASQYRLQQQPQNRDLAYTVALTNVLLRRVENAIAALEHVTQIDAKNPFAWGYLAFVHLYNWHPRAAETALKPALEMNGDIPELKALAGVAALFQGKIISAYRYLSGLQL